MLQVAEHYSMDKTAPLEVVDLRRSWLPSLVHSLAPKSLLLTRHAAEPSLQLVCVANFVNMFVFILYCKN